MFADFSFELDRALGDYSNHRMMTAIINSVAEVFPPDWVDDLDTSKPVLGFRSWSTDGEKLYPLIKGGNWSTADWKTGLNIAECYRGGVDCPCPLEDLSGRGCHCGFNAWFDINRIGRGEGKDVISGAILGAGNMQFHSQGFRSGEVQILALLYPSKIRNAGPRLAAQFLASRRKKKYDRIAEFYGVPIFNTLKELREYSIEFGLDLAAKSKQSYEEARNKVAKIVADKHASRYGSSSYATEYRRYLRI